MALLRTDTTRFPRQTSGAMNSDLTLRASDLQEFNLAGRRVAFLGKLGGMNRREAQDLVRHHGGTCVMPNDSHVELIVLGAEESPLGFDQLIDPGLRKRLEEEPIELLSETQLWQKLGMVEHEQNVRHLYTPAMLAELLDVSVNIIRRWHRRGLIVPVREVHRLPYFDFQEVSTARNLAHLLAAGASPESIEKKLASLSRLMTGVERPLAQLSIITEGRQLLLRQGEGLIDSAGQRRFDFEAIEETASSSMGASSFADVRDEPISTLPFVAANSPCDADYQEELIDHAELFEDTGRLQEAADVYRGLLVSLGPRAELQFRLAEVLYRLGEVEAARERYYMAIEIDEDYVEARANLGCVLAETGQLHLAIAAFQGTLLYHDDYPDVHYHLARCLDELDESKQSLVHWRRFLALSPDSPWASEARDRLGLMELES